MDNIAKAVATVLAGGKGILAADEGLPAIDHRGTPDAISSAIDTRRAYREMLLTTPDLPHSIGGVLLCVEAWRQFCENGEPFSELVARQGMIPGLRADTGAASYGSASEWLSNGLDSLADRLSMGRGVRFAKWRCVFRIEHGGLPSAEAIAANTHALAIFACECQQRDILPIVEPEVLMDGDHDLQHGQEVVADVLQAVFGALGQMRVRFDKILLAISFVGPGISCPMPSSDGEIAAATLDVVCRNVPPEVPGIVFLARGFAPERTVRIFRELISIAGRAPWRLSFSFGGTLQAEVLGAWSGKGSVPEKPQRILRERAAALADIARMQILRSV